MTMQLLLSMSHMKTLNARNVFCNIFKEAKLHSVEGPVSYILYSADKTKQNKTKLSWRSSFVIQ